MIRYVKKLWQEARRRDRRRRRRSSGFTMLEIMIVIAIIAALGAGVGVVVFNNFKKAQVKIGKQRITEVLSGVTQFMIDNNAHTWFSYLIVFGELAIGVGLVLGALVGVAAFFGEAAFGAAALAFAMRGTLSW